MKRMKVALTAFAAVLGIGGAVANSAFAPDEYKKINSNLYDRIANYNVAFCAGPASTCVYLINSTTEHLTQAQVDALGFTKQGVQSYTGPVD